MATAYERTTMSILDLGDGCQLFTGRLPDDLIWDSPTFDAGWALHPSERHLIKMFGKWTQTPRWQQAYGADYQYTGSRNNAKPIPPLLVTLLRWSQAQIDEALNGLLLNSYKGPTDYIGPHHDSTKDLVVGSPIVTISYGEKRTFRLTKPTPGPTPTLDFPASHGSVIVIPWDTNNTWKHSVPKRASYSGRRISVTLRAFAAGVLPPEHYFEASGHD